MNGGAGAALLAFIGHLATSEADKVPLLAPSLTVFVVGVLCAGLASGGVYFSQWFYATDKESVYKWGDRFNLVAISFGLISLILFAVGAWLSYRVFANFPPGVVIQI